MNRREHRAVVQAYRSATLSGATHRQAMGILTQAAQQAISGGPQAVQSFMASQGFPQDGPWCGQFAAAIVHSTGGTPPVHPEVASNWRNFGSPTNAPHPGDVAIRRGHSSDNPSNRVSTGESGSHVTFVGGVDPRTGTFTGVGGNQGANRHHPTLAANYPIRGFEFRTPTGQPSSSVPSVTNDNLPPPAQRLTDVARSEQIAPQLSSLPWPTPRPNATSYIPPEDISFAAPPPMPNNIPSAPPTSTPPAIPQGDASASFSFSPPTPSAPPSPQWQGSDAGQQFQPTDYTQMSPSLSYGQGYDDQGMSLSLEPSDYGYSYFSSPTGTWEPSSNYLDVSPTEQSQGDAVASQGGSDIASFGGDMSLGGDLPSATDAYLGIPGSFGGDAATQDFYAANSQYGEDGWYYNSQGDIVPVSSGAEPNTVAPIASSVPTPAGFGDLVQPPAMPSVQGYTGGFGVGEGPQYDVTPEGFSTGYIPFGGAGSGGSIPGSSGGIGGVGPQYSGGGVGGTGGSGGGGVWSTSYMHGGVNPFGGGTGGSMPFGIGNDPSSGLQVRSQGDGGGGSKRGMSVDAYLESLPQPEQVADQPKYITGWDWTKNPGSAMGHGSIRGWWSPQYTQGTGTDVAMPTVRGGLQHLALGGKVPGVDRGVDEVAALLEPGELVVNRSQMRGLKIGNSKFLRSDQKRAIKQAKKAA